ncbi:hypothetical protein GCM10022246_32040 [Pedobacter ginsengiterrae]|uniref:Uncharacterized protein n=1 Tax=Pedobacter ginsengiterrae TaxID=871696 RepID=A0ABP7Q6X6_9SPHI
MIDGTQTDKRYLLRRKKNIQPDTIDKKTIEHINNYSTQVVNDYVFGHNKEFLKGIIDLGLKAIRNTKNQIQQ